MGYYDQMQDDLDPSKTVLDIIWDLIPGEGHQVARGIAGRFLFSDSAVEKKVSSLSGGEKARLILARMVLLGPNFLVMDEPTNHLDIASREVVEGALDEFDGTLLTVSHDRYFLDREVNQIWEISGGQVHIFKGNYSEYLREKERGGRGQSATLAPSHRPRPAAARELAGEAARPKPQHPGGQAGGDDKAEREKQRREEKARLKKVGELKKRMDEIQRDIEKLEAEKKEIEDAFLDPDLARQPERIKDLSQRQKTTADSLDARYFKWQELEDRMKGIQEGNDTSFE
jgi:ATP-binding cassette subfamily F protein 3